MTRFHSSRPDNWTLPRRPGGLSREWVHGPLQPMDDAAFVDLARRRLPAVLRIVCWFGFGLAGVLALYHVGWFAWRAF